MRVVPLVLAISAAVAAQDLTMRADGVKVFQKGQVLAGAGKFAEAKQQFEKAREIFERASDPLNVAWMHSWIGSCHEGLKQYEPAYKQRAEALRRMLAFYGDTDHMAVHVCLNRTGAALRTLGRPVDAVPYFERGFAMAGRLYKDDHPAKAESINSLGAALSGAGRHEEALPHFKNALAMRQRLFKGDHAKTAVSHTNMGYCLAGLGRDAEALPYLEKALAMGRGVYKGDHLDLVLHINNFAMGLKELGRPDEALVRLEECVAMTQRIVRGDHPRLAVALSNLGGCFLTLGRFRDALETQKKVLAMRRRLFRGDHTQVALDLRNMATRLRGVGRPVEALPYAERALAMYERLLRGRDHAELARSVAEVADDLGELGRLPEALPHFKRALAMVDRVFEGDHPQREAMRMRLGICFIAMGKAADAVPHFLAALAMTKRMRKTDHAYVARGLNYLGAAYSALRRFDEALPIAKQSVAMWGRLVKGDHIAFAEALGNVGACLNSMGRQKEALPYHQRAVAMSRRLGAYNLHICAANLGTNLMHLRRPAEAIPAYEEAIAQIEEMRRGARSLDAHESAAFFSGLKGDWLAFDGMIVAQTRVGRADRALAYLERGRARSLLDLLARGRFDPLVEAHRQAHDRNDEATLARIRRVKAALEQAQRARGRSAEEAKAFRDLNRELTDLVRHAIPDAQPIDAAAIQGMLGKRERMLFFTSTRDVALLIVVGPTRVESHELSGQENQPISATMLREAVDRYRREILVRAGRTRGLELEDGEETGGKTGIGHRLFRALIPTKVWGDIKDASRVYVVPHGALHRLPLEALEVDAKGTYWLDGGPPIVYTASGTALLQSRKRRDAQKARELRVVALGDPVLTREKEPEPPASGVTVKAVANDSSAHKAGLLRGDVILAYDGKDTPDTPALVTALRAAATPTVTLRVWRRGQEESLTIKTGRLGIVNFTVPPPQAFAALKEASFDALAAERSGTLSRHGKLPSLPGTRREVLAIKKALGDRATILLGEDATRTKLYELAPKARYLHIATHYLADETEGASYSSLALTVPKKLTKNDDGFLRLIDVLERWRGRLKNCELVVLSACETQKGRMQKDEAVFAMPVGFQFAGAPSVIASLWRVEDESTADLFSDFYKRLAKGKGKLQAFTEARKALRKQRPEPYFWAPFIYMGDPR